MSIRIGIVVLSGLPAAGKTTLARTLMCYCATAAKIPTAESSKQTQACSPTISKIQLTHVCYDDIMTDRFYGGNSEAEENSWKLFRKYIKLCVDQDIVRLLNDDLKEHKSSEMAVTSKEYLQKGSSALQNSKTDETEMDMLNCEIPQEVILRYTNGNRMKRKFGEEGDKLCVFLIDDNMFLKSMRYEYYQLARKYGTGFCQIYVRCSVDEAQKQNSKRTLTSSTAVSPSTIINMASKFEVPDKENHWEVSSLLLDREHCSSTDSMFEVWQLIVQSAYQPVDKAHEVDETVKATDRLICSHNMVHQVDQILRREISKHLQILQSEKVTRKSDLKKKAALLNQKKSLLLEDVRKEKIRFPKSLESHVTEACKDEKNPFYIFVKELFER